MICRSILTRKNRRAGVLELIVTEAVLERCEAMGLPAANGPLWPEIRADIEAFPRQAARLLGIDINECKKLISERWKKENIHLDPWRDMHRYRSDRAIRAFDRDLRRQQ